MAAQNSTQIHNGTGAVTTSTGKRPISRWWPIGLLCSAILFFIIGGGLIGAWSTSECSYDIYDTYSCTNNTGDWNGGIACIAIGAILKFVFWVVLIVRCTQLRHSRAPSTVVYINAQAAAEAGTVEKTQPNANMYSVPQSENVVQMAPQYGAVAQAHVPVAEKVVTSYCGQCGTGTTTPFCSQCGCRVPM
jgi:hypothetical protein